jgi:hypothetical protein
MENPAFTKVNLSDVRIIMAIMRVLVEEFAISGGEGTYSSNRVPICQVRVGACGYILSCLALNGAPSQGPSSSGAYLILVNPQEWLPEALVCVEPHYDEKLQWVDRW